MERRELLFDGKEKQVYATDDPEKVIFRFKDVISAYDGIKRATLADKGKTSTAFSSLIFEYLRDHGVRTHYIERVSEDEQLCHKICIIPIEVVVHNYIAGSIAEKLGLEEGVKPSCVIYDLRYNNDALGDPLINDTQAIALGIATQEDLKTIYSTARRINTLLVKLFERAGLKLVDMKLEFGRAWNGEIIVSDEISPDTCRIWDAETDERLDKDRFRRDLGYIVAAYAKAYDRLLKVKRAA
ncbi:MAG: phosphoribosylaminoimidazolesuccinocarboxamide synthase [Bacteroidales bacterium]|nr:phosphoribosylaminoimidazolesuccinocarboxamide synthase [Bacteroidales bacterium]